MPLLFAQNCLNQQQMQKNSDVFELITISCTFECTTISSNVEGQAHNG